jgi:hypothetical protein
VWAQDDVQQQFIQDKMSMAREPTLLFPNIGRYDSSEQAVPFPEVAAS